jgi:hypothetical protein
VEICWPTLRVKISIQEGIAMKRSALCTTLAVMAFGLISMPAKADGGVEIVKYRCDPKAHTVFIGTSVSYGITSDFGKDIISLGKELPASQQKKECQFSPTDTAEINIHHVPHADGSNVNVTIHGTLVGTLPFSPDHDYSYIIDKYNDEKIHVVKSESVITRKTINWD